MDTFFEQIVVRKTKPIERLFQGIMIVSCAALCILLFFYSFTFSGSILKPVIMALGLGVPFAGYYALTSLYTEYEYSITNGYFDIDCIKGKRKRKRMISTGCDKIEVFGKYNDKKEQLSAQQFGSKVFAANASSDNLYYAIVNHKTKGRTLIIIEPNERVLSALTKFMPKLVARDAGFWN